MKKQENKGLSLIELVATMAIMAIVSTVVISFLVICIRHYEKVGNEVNLQRESQLAMNQIQELIIDATNGIGYESGKLFIYNKDAKTGEAEKIELVQKGEKIMYTRYTLDSNNVWQAENTSKNQPLADYISSFSAILYDKDGQEIAVTSESKKIEQVQIHLEFEWKGESFSSDNIVTLRNTVVSGTDIEKDF